MVITGNNRGYDSENKIIIKNICHAAGTKPKYTYNDQVSRISGDNPLKFLSLEMCLVSQHRPNAQFYMFN